MHVLVRTRVPLPQVLVHTLQVPHLDHLASTKQSKLLAEAVLQQHFFPI